MSVIRRGRAARLQGCRAGVSLGNKGAPNYTKSPLADQLCIIACGALAREILDIIAMNNLDHISLTCLPAKLHNHPEAIPDAVEKAISDARAAGFQRIFCGYADCGTGGLLDALLERRSVKRLPGAHCYAFFSTIAQFQKREAEDMRSFFLTDFLARHFDGLTWQPLGLDRHPELINDYFGAYNKIVYLAQTHNESLVEQASCIANRLGLPLEIRFTGYGDLERSLLASPS